ncbi:hypothetical protein HII12_000398 [Brettanomyces bruxellensis]|uniref:NADP-dependent oxidoreductase domain-containing protein n=1 Tax=Dekkera bruxellensis TaxID=5007 RepID=A0A8H6BQH3_DEKBR|nr:hypothetical protein HII12_000398 [Brettanomyces bruxellensis]
MYSKFLSSYLNSTSLGSSGAPLLKDSTLRAIAAKYDVSPATIILSWDVQRGIVVIPKSVNPIRIASNRKVVELADEDFKAVGELYKTIHKRFVSPDWGVNIFESDAHFN